MSEIKEKQGTLNFPATAVVAFPRDVDLTITLLHHPYNWFSQSSYRHLQSAVRAESNIVFTGHEHVQNAGEISDIKHASSVFVEGGLLFNPGHQDSSFNIVIVDLAKFEYMVEMYSYDGESYVSAEEAETWGSLQQLQVVSEKKAGLTPDWTRTLQDPGANFTHSAKKNLELYDFFVWPELILSSDTSPIKRNVLGSYFTDINNLNAGVLIKGEEKFGKTTLLYQLFKSYHERGYLPLYFKGTWFQRQHKDSPAKALSFALDKQYAKHGHTRFRQADKARRILILDNIDSCTLPPDLLSECLTTFAQYFENVIVTATDADAAMDILSLDRVKALNAFTTYEIREFGHKKRYELVCKWAELGGLTDVNSPQWMRSIDKWEKDLTAAVGRQFVPAVPIFLLTLLQSMEAGRSSDLQNSAFGHYYHFLITASLHKIGIDREQWGEVFNYCTKLAWFMFSSETQHVDVSQLRIFTVQYKHEFADEVTYERRTRDLIAAGILSESDGDISFRYPYLYFYFVGQHIGDNINDSEIQAVVRRLCSDLELRQNANILLFACHHTKVPLIYQNIQSSLQSCYENSRLFDLERDSELLNKLVLAGPKLVYEESTVKESRGAIREREDERTEASEVLARVSQSLFRLFRSMEILGQFLKNHYGTTPNLVKDELIISVINGALRGLLALAGSLLENSDLLLEHVGREAEMKGENRDERIDRAKRGIFELVSLMTFGFIHRASTSVGSTHLRENLRRVVSENPTLANRMIQISYDLDLPDGLSIGDIRRLCADIEKNVFAQALLRKMALRHLHLFKVDYRSKQKLCELLEIGIKRPAAITNEKAQRAQLSF
jgi:hypothetical protein